MQFLKRKNLVVFLIFLLVGLLVWILWSNIGNQVKIISLSDFEKKLAEYYINESDNKFISKFTISETEWVLRFQEIEKNARGGFFVQNYLVNISPTIANKINGGIALFPESQLTYFEVIKKAMITDDSEILNFIKNNRIETGYESAGIPQPSLFSRIFGFIPLLVSVGFPLLLLYFLYRSTRGSGNGGGIFGGPNLNSQATKITSDKKFSDIAGNREVKEEVMELVDYLKDPKRYEAAGARIPKGILLGGPPGTGKTLIAKATAGEANVPFFFISASNFVELYVGMGAKRVRELFKEARKEAPAIIFIDELDAVGRSRGSGIGGGNDEREQTLNQLLVEMDGIVDNSGILVIAATNRTDVLDPALQRPGRFDRTITVGYPDVREREEILRLHARGKRVQSSIDFKNIAKRTPGFSGAQLENVINEASILSVREKTEVITSVQIDEAIDRVMSGPAKKHRTITEEERIMVAYHEAGHAVVGIKIPGGNKVQKITIIPRGNAGGYNLMLPEQEKYNATKSELLATIASFMGGRVAEELIYGEKEISTGAANDIEKATKIARRMVTEFGMSSLGPIQYEENTGSPFLGRDYAKNMSFSHKVGHEIDLEVRKIISEAYEQAKNVISNNKELLELIKESLLENETIVAEEIEYIAKHMKLPVRKENEEIVNSKEIDINKLIEEEVAETKDSLEK
ncbi:ATP-dependent zinc metalloprotease FtsH [Mesomycoplasma molare]|uniref:ATP-dependent zinc metalloprotease FtsH n=1 Tax=Mesomycoplasma molare TaxID=171288 RepID=UPI00047F88AB|nr:ATP-dependent zinc metalloprotease FtsH [Mesomycoplasma molare]